MNYIVQIFNSEINEGFDVSELVYDIEYSTSLQSQPGKLTFNMRKDIGNSGFKLSIGNLVRFYCDEVPVFYGYIFTIKTDNSEIFSITAYDQMRYLQNHRYYFMKDENLADVFKKVCDSEKIENYRLLGKAKLLNKANNLNPHHFNDVSDFDIIQYAINETNCMDTTKLYEKKEPEVVEKSESDLKVGDIVDYIGGEQYTSSGDTIPQSINRTKGKAKITQIAKQNRHPYHLIGIDGSEGSNVYGWVDLSSIILTIKSETDNQPPTEISLVDNSYFFIRDNFGTLELNDIETNVKFRKTKIDFARTAQWTGKENYRFNENLQPELEPLIIGDESLLTSYEYEMDIDKDTYNQLVLMDTVKETSETKDKDKANKIISYSKQNDESVKKWGVLRKIVNLKVNYKEADEATKKQIEEYVELSLLEGSQITKSLRIEALGYNGVNAGDGFLLRLSKLGVEQMVYVLSATHHYGANMHTMSLEVATSNRLREVL